MQEFFKDVSGYEGIYQVSNLGRVKSLSRLMIKGKRRFKSKERILKGSVNTHGYLTVGLWKDGVAKKRRSVHSLVAEAFLKHTPCGYKIVVDHINDLKTDNRVENLQLVSQRFNSYKTQGKYSSKFKGVYFNKSSKKWLAAIYNNGKNNHLGLFNNEIEASEAYQSALLTLKKQQS